MIYLCYEVGRCTKIYIEYISLISGKLRYPAAQPLVPEIPDIASFAVYDTAWMECCLWGMFCWRQAPAARYSPQPRAVAQCWTRIRSRHRQWRHERTNSCVSLHWIMICVTMCGACDTRILWHARITIPYSKLLWVGILLQGNHQLPSTGIKPASVAHISETDRKVHLLYLYIFGAGGGGRVSDKPSQQPARLY